MPVDDHSQRRSVMNSTSSISATGYANTILNARKIVAWVPVAAYLAAVGGTAIYMFVNGPAIRAAVESYKAEQIDQENTQFCQKFNMPRGTDAFAACVSILTDIRKREADRVARDLAPGF
jgi:predicted AlkP superfamily phosphohydrolase/phosphomutase